MYMDRVSTSADGYVTSEFAQSRILITGLTATAGIDVARSFAELEARLIVHTAELSPELIELAATDYYTPAGVTRIKAQISQLGEAAVRLRSLIELCNAGHITIAEAATKRARIMDGIAMLLESG